jgi:hypothetical protein
LDTDASLALPASGPPEVTFGRDEEGLYRYAPATGIRRIDPRIDWDFDTAIEPGGDRLLAFTRWNGRERTLVIRRESAGMVREQALGTGSHPRLVTSEGVTVVASLFTVRHLHERIQLDILQGGRWREVDVPGRLWSPGDRWAVTLTPDGSVVVAWMVRPERLAAWPRAGVRLATLRPDGTWTVKRLTHSRYSWLYDLAVGPDGSIAVLHERQTSFDPVLWLRQPGAAPTIVPGASGDVVAFDGDAAPLIVETDQVRARQRVLRWDGGRWRSTGLDLPSAFTPIELTVRRDRLYLLAQRGDGWWDEYPKPLDGWYLFSGRLQSDASSSVSASR